MRVVGRGGLLAARAGFHHGLLALVFGLTLGCRDEGPSAATRDDPAAASPATLDEGALRASALEGLEAAARRDETAVAFGLAAALDSDSVETSAAALVAKLDDQALDAEAERLFQGLQGGEAMRAALVDYARAHPELDTAAISVGFTEHVGARLTRPELAAALRQGLRRHGRGLDPVLARAVLIDAAGARELATLVVDHVEALAAKGGLDETLGRDLAAAQTRLERRLGEPDRAAGFLTALGLWLADAPLEALAAEALASEQSGTSVAAGLTRALADESVRARVEALFALALAPSFEPAGFDEALDALLAEPVIEREAAAWLSGLARAPATREALAATLEQFAGSAAFETAVIEYVG